MACSSTSRKQVVSDALNCSICTDIMADPRALPCGHSYCGPSKPCLTALQKPHGILRCAICNESYCIKVKDLKPLYGIRDHLEEYSSEISAYQKEIKELRKKMENLQKNTPFKPPACSHSLCENLVSFWCKACKVEICDDCLETDHDKHSVVAFKKYLRREVEKKLSQLPSKENFRRAGKNICFFLQLLQFLEYCNFLNICFFLSNYL